MDAVDAQVAEQLTYYRQRAAEYDETSPLGHTQPERATVPIVVDRLGISGDVLELACGTGIWTIELARYAASLTAVDGAPEMLALARGRLAKAGIEQVEFVEADVFGWTSPSSYDVVLSGFLISHIPPERFEAFWELVASALRPGGRAIMLDEAPSRAGMETVRDGHLATRTLLDGSQHRIVKIFYEPADLVDRLAKLGWSATASEIEHGWLLVEATRNP